jgi:uncharacterized protein YfaS (alpha-2-macroglobulin family)
LLEGLAPGRWTVAVEAADRDGRAHRSTVDAWVAGADANRRAEEDELRLIPNRQSYSPADVAEVLLLAPFTPAHGLLLIERDGVVRTQPLHFTGADHTLRIPVEDAHIPGIHVHVLLAGAAERQDGRAGTRPTFAEASVYLAVPPNSRTLAVAITPRAPRLGPGEDTVLDLAVTAPDGSPVAGAGATVIVVDESVLAVAGYTNPDPLRVFYPGRQDGVSTARSRRWVLLTHPDDLPAPHGPESGPMGCADGVRHPRRMRRLASMPSSTHEPPIRTRSDFNPLALFTASVTTDADGRAAVSVTVPDNLTRYRVLAVAFGVGESS